MIVYDVFSSLLFPSLSSSSSIFHAGLNLSAEMTGLHVMAALVVEMGIRIHNLLRGGRI